MTAIFFVGLGGALGAVLRYIVGVVTVARFGAGFPAGTLAVNWIGSFAMGVLAALIMRGAVGEGARLFVGVGVLGGFTTFSAFSLDTVSLIERGQWLMLGGYTIASVAGSVGLLMAGVWLTRAALGAVA